MVQRLFSKNEITTINVKPESERKLRFTTTHIVKYCKIFAILIPIHGEAVHSVLSLTSDFHC